MLSCTCNSHAGEITLNVVRRFDPTHTLTRQKLWIADLMRRFTNIQQSIKTAVVTLDVFKLKPNKMLFNQIDPARFEFKTNPQKVEEFLEWLTDEINQELFDVYEGPARSSTYSGWQNLYIESAYKKGMTDGLAALRKGGYIKAISNDVFDIDVLFNTAIHAERVGYIYTRAFEELKGITSAMSQQISRTLAEGMANGDGPAVIARDLVRRVDKIGKTRARVLARTEVIRAHHKGKIQMFRDAGVVGVKVLAEWLTAGDDRVCPICAPQEGEVYPLDVIENLIPAHPQCRCTAIPAGVGEAPRTITGTDDFMELREERAEVTAKVRSILDTGAERGLSSDRIAQQIFEATRP